MSKLGFYCFTAPEPIVVPTLKEQIGALSSETKAKLLNGFISRTPVEHLDHKLGLSQQLIRSIYTTIDAIQEQCKLLMRGEVVVTPAVIDPETGEVTTPAVMNTPPATSTALKNTIKNDFVDIFTEVQITAILTKMIEYSKYDGSGTFSFYQSQIII